MSRMTATAAARSFSNVLNRVAAGEEIEVTRSGAPIAVIAPPKGRVVSAARFRELIASAPRPDADFVGDVRALRAIVEHLLSGLQAIPITETVARVHADTWADLAARGEIIDAHDLWIAATGLAHGFGIATRNVTDFTRIPGLRVVSPAS